MPASQQLATAALTDRDRQRRRNEDAYVLDPDRGIAVVADGMEGHPAGDVASALAADEVERHLVGGRPPPSPVPSQPGSPSALGERMVEAVRVADARLRSEAGANARRKGMGTTLTAMMIRPDEGRVTIGHVGDSRAYLYEGCRLRQLTRDDTWVQEQVDAGTLSRGQARMHPRGHVLTKGVGVGDGIRPGLLEGETVPARSACYARTD